MIKETTWLRERERKEEQLRYILYRTTRSFFLLAEDRLIDIMDDIFLIWQCCTSPLSV